VEKPGVSFLRRNNKGRPEGETWWKLGNDESKREPRIQTEENMKLLPAPLLLLLCPLSLMAQGRTPITSHVHSTAPTTIIDGAKTPNLIPDVAAWRLWLLAVNRGQNQA
jgi:hypothetical protein